MGVEWSVHGQGKARVKEIRNPAQPTSSGQKRTYAHTGYLLRGASTFSGRGVSWPHRRFAYDGVSWVIDLGFLIDKGHTSKPHPCL